MYAFYFIPSCMPLISAIIVKFLAASMLVRLHVKAAILRRINYSGVTPPLIIFSRNFSVTITKEAFLLELDL